MRQGKQCDKAREDTAMVDMDKLAEDVGELDEDAVNDALKQVMDEGGVQAQDAMEACQKGMSIVGDRFEQGEYFVGDLIYAGELMTGAVGILKDALVSGGEGGGAGKLVLCTVKNDLHDIGKNIVKAMLEAAGFEVIDLGIDTPADKIVEAVRDNDVHILALSGVLTLALDSMKDTVDALAEAGLRDTTKVIIGGAPVNEQACANVGADEWAYSPQKTVDTCKKWAEESAA
jgi:dimethylamine corrinoid protein